MSAEAVVEDLVWELVDSSDIQCEVPHQEMPDEAPPCSHDVVGQFLSCRYDWKCCKAFYDQLSAELMEPESLRWTCGNCGRPARDCLKLRLI